MSLLERNCSRKGAGSWEEAGTFPSEPPLGIHLMSAEVHVIPAAGSGDSRTLEQVFLVLPSLPNPMGW